MLSAEKLDCYSVIKAISRTKECVTSCKVDLVCQMRNQDDSAKIVDKRLRGDVGSNNNLSGSEQKHSRCPFTSDMQHLVQVCTSSTYNLKPRKLTGAST